MFKITIFTLFILAVLSGCSADYKKLSQNSYSSESKFNKTLIKEYKKLAEFEAEEMHDWNSAKLYSIKAIKSYEGKLIKPEPIINRNIKDEHKNDLLKAYENLLVIYEQSLEKDPINLALAITSLDCWAEQQEEGWQIDHIEKCKSKFIKSTNEIYINLKDEKLIKDLENESNKTIDSLQKKEIEKIVYFDFDDYILSEEKITEIKKIIRQNINKKYIILGHTDTKGSKEYNYKLSKKRAMVIQSILIDYGISQSNILIYPRGENKLAVFTPDETPHPANRRAVINITY